MLIALNALYILIIELHIIDDSVGWQTVNFVEYYQVIQVCRVTNSKRAISFSCVTVYNHMILTCSNVLDLSVADVAAVHRFLVDFSLLELLFWHGQLMYVLGILGLCDHLQQRKYQMPLIPRTVNS